jgi:hypothetical protein
MPARKVRLDVFDTEGNRYSISFEGQVTRDKALRLLDLIELLGGVPGGVTNGSGANPQTDLSKYDKLRIAVQKHFPVVWFSSREVQSVYEQELKEPISLSTVGTYLSRLATKGVVVKSGPQNNLKYKLSRVEAQEIMKQNSI